MINHMLAEITTSSNQRYAWGNFENLGKGKTIEKIKRKNIFALYWGMYVLLLIDYVLLYLSIRLSIDVISWD